MTEEDSLSHVMNKSVIKLVELLVLVDTPQHYSLSKAAEKMDVSVSSVSRAANKLLELGWLVMDEVPTSRTGRPSKVIGLNYGLPVVNALADLIEEYHDFLTEMKKTAKVYKLQT